MSCVYGNFLVFSWTFNAAVKPSPLSHSLCEDYTREFNEKKAKWSWELGTQRGKRRIEVLVSAFIPSLPSKKVSFSLNLILIY